MQRDKDISIYLKHNTWKEDKNTSIVTLVKKDTQRKRQKQRQQKARVMTLLLTLFFPHRWKIRSFARHARFFFINCNTTEQTEYSWNITLAKCTGESHASTIYL